MNYYDYRKAFTLASDSDVSSAASNVDIEEHNRRFHHGKQPEPGHCKYLEERSPEMEGGGERLDDLSDEDSLNAGESGNPRNKHDYVMKPSDCEKMIRRAFAVGDIRGYYGYKTPQEWFEKEGPRGVAEIVDNYSELYRPFVEPIADDIDSIQDVLESYKNGTLVGPQEAPGSTASAKTSKVDTSGVGRIDDPRFYSSTKPAATKEDWNLACRPTRGKDRDAIEAARARVLFHAHRKGACDDFGVTQKEMNAKLRSWSAYPVSAMRLSNQLNEGVGEGSVWSGIENMSGLSQYLARKEDVASLVKSIDGDPDQFQKNYIARTMLAIDTHTDFSDLKFKFEGQPNPDKPSCNGYYSHMDVSIVCKPHAPNTVAHEMGHYLDDKWGKDLGYGGFLSDSSKPEKARKIESEFSEAKTFSDHYRAFIDSLDEVADEHSAYTLDRKEIFARFVSRFVQWTEEKARGANRCFRGEYGTYNDHFDGRHFTEFVKILQEKAALDAKLADVPKD
ncbi:MAG: hypothetical protein MJZ81_09570 [Bacteroidales bacterium]|nr:hypothetical protein [Bacteroidales bacterium]